MDFNKMAENMAKGDAQDINVDDLLKIKEEVVLLDSREHDEYNISHIPSAKWVGYDDFSIERLDGIDKNSKIVVYCSVGYRSERISEKLMKEGYKNVYNLKGSIFKWYNEGYKIVDPSGVPTRKIHGFNKKWSKWIKDGDIIY
jgi:rhodanese-related sulfurtransferase